MSEGNFQAANALKSTLKLFYDHDTGVWASNFGSFLNRGELGVEAFDADEVFVGMFADEDLACNAILDRWESRSNGGDDPHPMLTAALDLAKQRDWKVFPARMEDGKKYSWLSKEHAPGGENWGMTSDPEQLQHNFLNPKWRLKCGVGVPTGWVNRIFDIEGDTQGGPRCRRAGVTAEAGGEARQAAGYADGGEPHGLATSHLQSPRQRHQGHQPQSSRIPRCRYQGRWRDVRRAAIGAR